ncbi:putative sugar O-acetyltransferase [Lipomyces doorenjongii]
MASTEKNARSIAHGKTLTPWCDDYEKMISGMNRYNLFVPESLAGRLRSRKLVKKFNEYLSDDATNESLAEGRNIILKELIGHVGKGVYIDPPLGVDYGCNIAIGDGFFWKLQYGDPKLRNRDYWRSDEVWTSVSIFAAAPEGTVC